VARARSGQATSTGVVYEPSQTPGVRAFVPCRNWRPSPCATRGRQVAQGSGSAATRPRADVEVIAEPRAAGGFAHSCCPAPNQSWSYLATCRRAQSAHHLGAGEHLIGGCRQLPRSRPRRADHRHPAPTQGDRAARPQRTPTRSTGADERHFRRGRRRSLERHLVPARVSGRHGRGAVRVPVAA
jgi:hypothetical protein